MRITQIKTRPGSIGPAVESVMCSFSEIISTCNMRPTSKGSGA